MDIVIPTYGRALSQTTLLALVKEGIKPFLVVQDREKEAYEQYAEDCYLKILPDSIRTIAPTRQWIIDHVGVSDHIVMLDDDLVFFRRRLDYPDKLRDLFSGELPSLFVEMAEALESVPHVGIAAREGANRDTSETRMNTRIMRVLGYDRSVLQKESITFGRMAVMEDFDVALRLLRLGYDNVVLNEWANNQAGSGKEGGCSHFRTPELHAASASKLAAFHPGFVKVVKKTTKGAWGGGERTDVTIQWKKARESANAQNY